MRGVIACTFLVAMTTLLASCGGSNTHTVVTKTETVTTGSASSSAAARVLAPQAFKPTSNWCPTHRTCLRSVTWTSYTSDGAEGYGPAKECAGGGGPCMTHARVDVVLSAPADRCGAIRFTRLKMFGYDFTLDSTCSTYQRG